SPRTEVSEACDDETSDDCDQECKHDEHDAPKTPERFASTEQASRPPTRREALRPRPDLVFSLSEHTRHNGSYSPIPSADRVRRRKRGGARLAPWPARLCRSRRRRHSRPSRRRHPAPRPPPPDSRPSHPTRG